MKSVVWLNLIAARKSLEVSGWKPHLFGIAACVAIVNDETRVYTEASVPELMSLLHSAERIVGYNLAGFDLQVLSAYGSIAPLEGKLVDLAAELAKAVQYRVSFGNVLSATLDRQRMIDSQQQEQLWREGLCLDAIAACYQDVADIKSLYEHGVQTGNLSCSVPHSGEKRAISVQWIGKTVP